MKYNYKILSRVQTEDSFSSSSDRYFLVEDNGEIKRLKIETLEIEFSGETGDEEYPATCNKTFTEIKQALESGRPVIATYGVDVLPLVTKSNFLIRFASRYYDDDQNEISITCQINSYGVVFCKEYSVK